MPSLDVSDVLDDPLFRTDFSVKRSVATVGANGRPAFVETVTPTTGVVTSEAGQNLSRTSDARNAVGRIMIHTKFYLYSGEDGTEPDIILWHGREWTIIVVNDYSEYGLGFVSAVAEIRSIT